MKAILLVRVSSTSQQLDEQTQSLIKYANEKGYSQSSLVIIEDIESAINLPEEERNGLNRMKEAIANDKDINAVFVWELSRLTRQATTAYSIRDYFVQNHIQLFCLSPEFRLLKKDLSTIDNKGSILYALFIEMAEAEMRNKKDRFHRSKIRNAKIGKYSGGFVKFGYRVNEKGYYEISETQAELIKYIFNEYEKGRSTYNIWKELKERGIIDTQFFVRGILTSDCYTGLSNQYGMNRTYPQIISIEQFNRCREIAKQNNKKADKTPEIYYCKKLIKCMECGSYYIGMKSSSMYLCYGKYGKEARLFPEKACQESPIININVLDSLVWHVVREFEVMKAGFSDPEKINTLKHQITINEEKIANGLKIIQNIEKKRERNNTMFFNGQISEEKYTANSELIDKEVRELNNLIKKSANENEVFRNRIEDEEKDKNDLSIYSSREEYLDSLSDKEKQLLILKNVLEINIFEGEPNKTKIVVINFDYSNSQTFRIHIKKKPVLVEKENSPMWESNTPKNLNDRIFGETEDWVEYPIEIKKRITRYSGNATS